MINNWDWITFKILTSWTFISINDENIKILIKTHFKDVLYE